MRCPSLKTDTRKEWLKWHPHSRQFLGPGTSGTVMIGRNVSQKHESGTWEYLTLPAGWANAQRWDLQCGSSAQPRSARRLSQSLRGPKRKFLTAFSGRKPLFTRRDIPRNEKKYLVFTQLRKEKPTLKLRGKSWSLCSHLNMFLLYCVLLLLLLLIIIVGVRFRVFK